MIAKDTGDSVIKTFALDRLTNLEITKKLFVYPGGYDVEESFRYCFGIIGANEGKPVEIVLSFDPHQGKYIKSLHLQHTQKVLVDHETRLHVKLKR